jgi:hypothetical protein
MNLKVFLLCFLFNLPLHNMQYEPLDKTKNDIRVLKFVDPLYPISAEDSIECMIENVPLDEGSFYSQSDQSYIPNQECPMIWDDFAECVDLRDTTLEGLTLDEATTKRLNNQAHKQLSNTRFAWGDFEALSYTWGDGGKVKEIKVNGMHKYISKNLEAALRALRDLKETRDGMRYWVDSLCINQEDEGERNEQVKRMREIYSRARAVVVWLGQEEKPDKVAVQIMRRLCRDPDVGERVKLPKDIRDHQWHALLTFTQKPYWSRAWIIQELAMNQNSTLILCGRHKLTRRMLRLGGFYCKEFLEVREDQYSRSLNLDWDAWTKASRMRRLAKLDPKPSVGVELSPLLDLVRQADATDPRDKVYSILGLIDPAISADVDPDYSLPVQQVYTDFMIAIINQTKSLDQILYGGIPSEKMRLWPSWVPDSRLPFVRRHNQYLETRKASGLLPARVKFCKKGERCVLICHGFRVDKVDGITAGTSPRRFYRQSRYASDRYDSGTAKALEQTLVMGHPGATKQVLFEIPWQSKISQSSYYSSFQDFRERSQAFRIGGKDFESFYPQHGEQIADIKTTLACIRLVMLSLDDRALITTKTGYLGLAPKAVRPGDIIAILLGCKCPVVLRPFCNGMFRVVGECYIHGLMDGEILSQGRDELEFILC